MHSGIVLQPCARTLAAKSLPKKNPVARAAVSASGKRSSVRIVRRRHLVEAGREPRTAQGTVKIVRRDFHVERLTVPNTMVDLDPETERRAVAEGKQMAALYRTITPERLWRGRFTSPLGITTAPSGFGARRIINGQPRSPHSGSDYKAPTGTPVVAVNTGKVALVAEFFFPGRLVIVDHGVGLYTAYFHLDSTAVAEGERVERGQNLGTVGATGRATVTTSPVWTIELGRASRPLSRICASSISWCA